MTPRARRLLAGAETVATAAVAAWVGGYAALGAFGARIVFRDLPRAEASTTMTTVFRSFDHLVAAALVLLVAAMVLRAALLGPAGRRGAELVALAAAVALVGAGLAGLLAVHPAIERMFHAGETLTPAFAALHKTSERLGHLEVASALVLFGAFAWRRGPA